MRIRKIRHLFLALLFVPALFVLSGPCKCCAVAAYDFENNADVDLLCDRVPAEGDEIEMFDFRSGDYREVYIESRTDTDSGVDLVVADSETGAVRKLRVSDFELKDNAEKKN